MDVKTLSAMLGHVSAATTLTIYTHVTGDMQSETATKIGRGLGNEVEDTAQSEQPHLTDVRPGGGTDPAGRYRGHHRDQRPPV